MESETRIEPPAARDRRRRVTHPFEIASTAAFSLRELLRRFAPGFEPGDILSTRHHSQDFIDTRAEYIAYRVRFMTWFYAIAVPSWIPLDYLLVRPEHFAPLATIRLIMSAVLIGLGMVTLRKLTSRQVHVVLTLSIFVTCLFYTATMLTLQHGTADPPLAGYTSIPFLTVAMLGVFPLTLAWGCALIALVVAMTLGLYAFEGRLLTMGTLDELWVLVMVGGISLWIEAGQMLMLLKLYRESTQDPLTGLINRRVLIKRLRSLIEHRDDEHSFCVLMFDLDRFKRINDKYGHLTGDIVLRTAADILRRGLRRNDIVARFGGEEFVAVLAGATSEGAIAVAERIRKEVASADLFASGGERLELSTSVGVTAHQAGETIDAMLNRVDGLLYKAKQLGRNRVVHCAAE